ncbi:glutathione-dependent formaldehyde-activating enzyme [Metarhizium rileyi]|uniref:Glutathione-dependent formaldehyde-activating enzyme n=1 Tax=Metarhizium rileyi (strain RCEF 4871) TaxID=1649241 RepID=A0A162KDR4_METRR|nr:glutathione-dependent formaldehyde-activating enzyme [Metarhizium rileyi RCEF 4871]
MASADTQQTLRTYRGNCHCKAFVYEIQVPEIKAVKQCNCSICHKKGYLWVLPETVDHFKIVKGCQDTLSSYGFNAKNRIHKAHTLQGIDTWALQKDHIDHAEVEPMYKVPVHKGPEPAAEIEGGKLYKGGCHCGSVTIAVTSKPLDETFEDGGLECNCSICERNGYVWTYPLNEQVVLHAEDPSKIGRYGFSQHILLKTFCRTCGVNLSNEYNADKTEEQKAGLSEDTEKWEAYARLHHPVNLRVLPEVDIYKMTRRYNKGFTAFPPQYENP